MASDSMNLPLPNHLKHRTHATICMQLAYKLNLSPPEQKNIHFILREFPCYAYHWEWRMAVAEG